jgi:hypothetical protein
MFGFTSGSGATPRIPPWAALLPVFVVALQARSLAVDVQVYLWERRHAADRAVGGTPAGRARISPRGNFQNP